MFIGMALSREGIEGKGRFNTTREVSSSPLTPTHISAWTAEMDVPKERP
jgi:hypothetical protein